MIDIVVVYGDSIYRLLTDSDRNDCSLKDVCGSCRVIPSDSQDLKKLKEICSQSAKVLSGRSIRRLKEVSV